MIFFFLVFTERLNMSMKDVQRIEFLFLICGNLCDEIQLEYS